MKTAMSAGMYPVGVLWGFRKAEELVENGARILIADPAALLDLL
jgi:phosphoglycolate phosphatase